MAQGLNLNKDPRLLSLKLQADAEPWPWNACLSCRNQPETEINNNCLACGNSNKGTTRDRYELAAYLGHEVLQNLLDVQTAGDLEGWLTGIQRWNPNEEFWVSGACKAANVAWPHWNPPGSPLCSRCGGRDPQCYNVCGAHRRRMLESALAVINLAWAWAEYSRAEVKRSWRAKSNTLGWFSQSTITSIAFIPLFNENYPNAYVGNIIASSALTSKAFIRTLLQKHWLQLILPS